MSELTPDDIRWLKQIAETEERRERLGDLGNDAFFERLWDMPYALAAIVTLTPKPGSTWTEERLNLWLEVMEKTARLVYGLPSEWRYMVEEPPEDKRPVPAGSEPERQAPAQAEGQIDGSDSSTSDEEPESEMEDEPEEEPEPSVAQRRGAEDAIVAVLRRSTVTLRKAEIAERLGVSKFSLDAPLTRLREAGLVESFGAASGTTYGLRDAEPNGKPHHPHDPTPTQRILGALAIESRTPDELMKLGATRELLAELVRGGHIQRASGRYALSNELRKRQPV